jgi:hypothetical protein
VEVVTFGYEVGWSGENWVQPDAKGVVHHCWDYPAQQRAG